MSDEPTDEPASTGPPASAPVATAGSVPVHSPLRRILLTMLIPLSVGAVCFVGVALKVVSDVKSHPAYAAALAAVRADPQVRAALGTPVEPGFLAQGGTDATDGVFEAMFSVEGPTGDAGVRVLAEPEGVGWRLTFLDVGANLADGRAKVVTLADEASPRRFGVQRDALAEPLGPVQPPIEPPAAAGAADEERGREVDRGQDVDRGQGRDDPPPGGASTPGPPNA